VAEKAGVTGGTPFKSPYVLGARYPVIDAAFGFWKCGLAFSCWESAGREGEAVRGVFWEGESKCVGFPASWCPDEWCAPPGLLIRGSRLGGCRCVEPETEFS
jgi:hypothetical protein